MLDLMQKVTELSPGKILPVPVDYLASHTAASFFTWYAGGFALLVLPWVFYKLLKKNDSVPLMMWIGGLFTSLQESAQDTMGHLWWPTNLPGPAYIGYDLHVPLLIPPCYVFFIAMTGYWAYTRIKKGLTVRGVFTVWLLISLTDVFMEIPGTATAAYIYYGDAPFKILGFPLAWGWLNGTCMLMTGFLLWLVEPHLRQGWRRLMVIFVAPLAFGGAYGMVSWPYFNALNWPLPVYATWLWTAFSLVMCLIVVRFIGAMVARATGSGRSVAL